MSRAIIVLVMCAAASPARAAPTPTPGVTLRCDDLSTDDLSVDGLLDDWSGKPLIRIGDADSAIAVRCSWDGRALGLALLFDDDRVVRVRGGRGHEDRVDLRIAAGGRPAIATIKPGSPIAKPAIVKPSRAAVASSLQPHGFSIEARFPAAVLPGLSPSTPSLSLSIVFHDSDKATGGDDEDLTLAATIELGDRKDLLVDFLRTVKLRRSDVRLDALADLDPDRRGNERVVAGGTVIGVLTDKFAYVTVPAARAADVARVELIPLGRRGSKLIAATVRQTGNGGSRDLLMLWTVWSGQLEPLASIEIRKQLGANVLEAEWKIVKGKKGPELWVEPKPAVGFTAKTWNEEPAADVDSIVLPWNAKRGGIAYFIEGKELQISRRDLPVKKPVKKSAKRRR